MTNTPEIAGAKRKLELQATECPNWARQLLDYIAQTEADAMRYRKLRPTIYPCGNYACFGRVPITYDPDQGELERIREQADEALDAMPNPQSSQGDGQ